MRTSLRSPRLVRRQRRVVLQKRIAALFLALALLGGALYLLTRPQFFITDITVVGESPVPKEEVRSFVWQELAGEYLFAFPKAHVFLYPRRLIEQALRLQFPAFESVHVSLRNLGSVSVALTPRRPVVAWCAREQGGSEGTGCFLADKTGFVFDRLPSTASSRYPRFLSRTATSSDLIGTVALSEERLRTLLSLLGGLEAFGLEVLETELFAGGEVVVHLRSGGKILLREDGEFATELNRLELLLAEKGLVPRGGGDGLRVDYIDLRYGNKIYFKPR